MALQFLIGKLFKQPAFENHINTRRFGPHIGAIAYINFMDDLAHRLQGGVRKSEPKYHRFKGTEIPMVTEIRASHVEAEPHRSEVGWSTG